VVVGWSSFTHDTQILNHVLASFSSFSVPRKGKLIIVTDIVAFTSFSKANFFRQILSSGLQLSKQNWISCIFQGDYISFTRISSSLWASTTREACDI
jgi:hypothetical protein